ncbi:hypothetical protein MWU77_19980 [Rhodococcus sp. F64268]|uniref:DUF6779 domain-containing protein n=1 Tax=Rhodococcus sp. F64268 TaxID=2926402 RepID=UPI001FF30AEC|nr:DUF6779 domain-containing protein [Rhodococcus sp. F64268]MCK0093061.1 hypothetical protein [Rhodococcus sp. F64268]
MVFRARGSKDRRPWRSSGSVIVAGLLALAMVASLLLVFSDSVQMLRIAVVVALWCAVVGAIAMTKYRRESALDRAKAEDLKTVYELQLDREISARREYELGVEEKVRSELRIDADEMTALRTELAALRRSLEALFDGKLPDDGLALEGESVRELDSAPRVNAPSPSGPAFASPDDEPLTAETEIVTSGAEQSDAERAVDAESDDAEAAAAKSDTPGVPAGRRARRRRDAEASGSHVQGRSVAEILANLSSDR